MAIRQLSVLVENRKGTLGKITGLLAENDIDLRSICVADTEDYGIMRLIADDNRKAAEILSENGYIARVREVVAIAISDETGGLNRVLQLLDANDINLEYMYSMITGHSDKALMILRVDDNEKTEKLLSANGVEVLGEKDIMK